MTAFVNATRRRVGGMASNKREIPRPSVYCSLKDYSLLRSCHMEASASSISAGRRRCSIAWQFGQTGIKSFPESISHSSPMLVISLR